MGSFRRETIRIAKRPCPRTVWRKKVTQSLFHEQPGFELGAFCLAPAKDLNQSRTHKKIEYKNLAIRPGKDSASQEGDANQNTIFLR